MKYDFWMKEREAATVLPCGLKVNVQPQANGTIIIQAWKPKATKPAFGYRFKSIEAGAKYVAEFVASYEKSQAAKAAWKAEKAGTPEDLAKITVGMIFRNSWGYEQTQVDYYQVVTVKGKSVTIKAIAAESVGATSHDSDRVKPVKDAFLQQCAKCSQSPSSRYHQKATTVAVVADESLAGFNAFMAGFPGFQMGEGELIEGAHEYQEAPPITKRIQFYGGEPVLAMSHGGSASLVKEGETAHRSWGH